MYEEFLEEKTPGVFPDAGDAGEPRARRFGSAHRGAYIRGMDNYQGGHLYGGGFPGARMHRKWLQ